MVDSHPADNADVRQPPAASPRITIVGPCASGKSTLVQALRALGYDAKASAQEHSVIPTLWRHSHPDILIALQADIAAVRARRDEDWPEWLHDVQLQRLHAAAEAADLTIDTSHLNSQAVAAQVVAFLSARAQQ